MRQGNGAGPASGHIFDCELLRIFRRGRYFCLLPFYVALFSGFPNVKREGHVGKTMHRTASRKSLDILSLPVTNARWRSLIIAVSSRLGGTTFLAERGHIRRVALSYDAHLVRTAYISNDRNMCWFCSISTNLINTQRCKMKPSVPPLARCFSVGKTHPDTENTPNGPHLPRRL